MGKQNLTYPNCVFWSFPTALFSYCALSLNTTSDQLTLNQVRSRRKTRAWNFMAVAAAALVVRLAVQKQTDSTKVQNKMENWKQSLPPPNLPC